ncbi:MAG TPA: FtsW/RodA/SpoVE family cell cycle protein, partial [Candidatus Merdenecus merdavium]|nr:FtsW/RodA/SpoVE family cell cycle protein [Candidatus Merdenecus merdavium]
LYTFSSYTVFRHHSEKKKNHIFTRQIILMFIMHFVAYVVMILSLGDKELVIFYGAQVIYLAATLIFYRFLYPKASRLVINHMCMLISIGFIIQTRLSYKESTKQFKIIILSTIIGMIVPVLIRKLKFLKDLTWLYAAAGIGLLGFVAIFAGDSYGAKMVMDFGSFAIQPSEFVKIIFVFFVASMLYKNTSFQRVVFVSCLAGAHVLILAASKDLGSALIFFVAYLVMLYAASKEPAYLFGGIGVAVVGVFGATKLIPKLFNHVKVRIAAWKDPFAIYDTDGYQMAQSLFAIGTGGWFGLGLGQGLPNSIPIVAQDFVFSAISEELGGIFSICLILLCMSCFIMFVNISMQIKNKFYKLVALGLGSIYGIQVFLTIGGAIKFIPSTGVTLPLVSYGGSSMLSTLILFGIIQGMYILREDEDEIHEKQKQSESNKKETIKQEDTYGLTTEDIYAQRRAKEAKEILEGKRRD